MDKKNFRKACNFRATLAYLFFKCGVVVELVTTLACHAGGRGFKSPPSRHFLFLLLLLPSLNSFAETIKIIAKNDSIYSFTKTDKDIYNFKSKKEVVFLGANFIIMKKIMDDLKLSYTFQIVPESDIERLLQSGEADIALDVQKNNQTIKFADFPRTPLREEEYFFFGRKQDAKSEKMTYENVLAHNYLVGIQVGFRYPKEFWQAFPDENFSLNSHLIEAQTNDDNIHKLSTKRIDLFLAEKNTAELALKKLGKEDAVVQYRNILFWINYYCAFSKKSSLKNIDEIKEKIQRSLYKMQEKNLLQEIVNSWIFLEEK